MNRRPPKQTGFTILELMMTLVVVGVLASLAAPNMRTFILNNRLTSTANEMLQTLLAARAEATKLQDSVVVCTSSNPTAATPTCSTSGITGWIAFQDNNHNWDHDSTEEIIGIHTFESDKMHLLADNSMRLSFAASGFSSKNGTTPATQTSSTIIVICDGRGNSSVGGQSLARGLQISPTGRVSLTRNPGVITNMLSTIGASCS